MYTNRNSGCFEMNKHLVRVSVTGGGIV